ncbi:MAG: hypothetical protein ACT4P5_05400 [Armatimonadota bacterium]
MTRIPSLVIVGNGPGEVAGWAVPVGTEARLRARDQGHPIEIGLCLPPCQFASGQEMTAAASAGVFDTILDPRKTFRLGLGLPGWAPSAPPVILHVGGSFWYTQRLARRWRGRAFAFVERAHIAPIHRSFERIFVPTEELRARVLARRVPADKVIVTGDPRYDAVFMHERSAGYPNGNGVHPRITFLAGSRDTIFSAVFPFWVRTAVALRAELPAARLQAVISQFVSPSVHEAVVAQHRRAIEAAGVDVEYGGWPKVVGSDLVLTIPGTNTIELAIMRIPSMVVMPFSLTPRVPAEGLIEWILRVPYAGPALRQFLARQYVRRRPYVALPNMRAGRRIMPELVGRVTPEQVAAESARIIRDDRARAALAEALTAIPVETGACRRILDAMGLAGARA